ncbi:MAG TPA: hypothetical protein VM029_13630 [Opitutaceae bacterium]|nr:hypothetical protein [Opitutaceae bacterium]
MKKIPALMLSCALAILAFAQDGAKKSSSNSPVIPASAAVLKAPFVLKDGAFGQPDVTELSDGGKATFDFTVPAAGNYVIHAVVDASGEEANSFFLNIDGPPEDPGMIWDIDVTNGFAERVVSWRGKGEADSDEFKPKVFKLTAGAHKLYLVGREPAQLQSVSIRAAQ